MKNNQIKLWSMCAMLLLVTACNENSQYLFGAKEPFIKAKAAQENDAFFTPNAQQGYVNINSNAPWEAKSLTDWITCSTTKGEFNGKVYFDILVNKGDTRTGKIVVYNTVGDQKCDTLIVTQECAAGFMPSNLSLDIQSKSLTKELDGQTFTEVGFEVTSSTPWRVYTKPAERWSTVLTKKGQGNSTGSFVVTRNDALEKRSMYIYVQSINYPTLKDSILVNQAGRPVELKVLSPANKKILLDESESKFVFSVKGDGKWKIQNIPSWLHLDKTEYEGNANITVLASAATGERTAQLVIQSLVQDDKKNTLDIEQKIIPSGRLKDSLALVAIYNATGGERWLYNWKFELPLSEGNWPGVFFDVIDGELRVIDLSLGQFNLEGTIPNEIGWLSKVAKIKMQRNKIYGPMPASMNRLTELTHIYLSVNNISGELPDLSALKKLVLLDLDFNRIEGEFPSSLTQLTKLTSLKMKYNNLSPNTCVPAQFGGWKLVYINPQRRVYGDATTDYKLADCPK